MNIKFDNVYIENVATVAGPFVIEGPLNDKFDKKFNDFYDGEKTFEQCEIKELIEAVKILLKKTNKNEEDIDVGVSVDLMNQLTISNFAYSRLNIPYLGIYNACASMCEAILLASSMIDGGKVNNAICTTSSHNMTAERQFRNPVEYGAPKPKTTTFTVTGATSIMLTNNKTDIKVTSATIGKVIDMGVMNVFDMGSVMTPSAAYTLNEHLKSTNTKVDDYDLILTGDLGVYGKKIFKEYCKEEYGINIGDNYDDSATRIYDYKENIYAGGSGPSCLPLVVYSDIIPKMKSRSLKKVLLIATGALMSPTTCNQKLSIPSVSHAICLEVI
ncbi:MAG: stage V sporulation protein AD [Bacilli bacterium]|nr:stage V sporulation protein AD [Bacilli bacterium]